MSITTSEHTPADRGRPIKPTKSGCFRVVPAAYHRWRARLRKVCGLFTTTALALCAMSGCDGTSGSTTSGAASSCPGSISIAWSITENGQPSSCFRTRAASVALRLQSRTGGTPVFTAFPCARNAGTANIAPGLYDVAIELHDANGAKLDIAPTQTSVAVAVGRTTVLNPAAFSVNGGGGGGGRPGNLLLSLQAEGSPSNCLPPPGGPGVTGMSITLVTAGGSCAAVTLIRSRGGVEVGTYQVNCGSPPTASCIENDERLTAPSLEPGTYMMHVQGSIGPLDCFAADAALEVPQTGQLQRQIVLQRQNRPGC
jgi:hypothetical protein